MGPRVADQYQDSSLLSGSALPARTHKMLIGGAYTRSESGHTYLSAAGRVPQASRKDARNAVSAARKGYEAWGRITPYQRGQILYRLAELLSERSEQIYREISLTKAANDARAELTAGVSKLVWHAGWPDKFSQVFGSSNTVSQSYVSGSTPLPVGIIASTPRADMPFADLVDAIGSALASGSAVIVLASQTNPIPAVTLAEVAGVCDLPPGVLNVLTGEHREPLLTLAGHGDVNALDLSGSNDTALAAEAAREGAEVLKRVLNPLPAASPTSSVQRMRLACDTRTVWHPYGY